MGQDHRASHGFEQFEHGADIGLRGFGATLEESFEQVAYALGAVVTDPSAVACSERVAVTCTAPDVEMLLVDWLNAIIAEMGTRHMVFGRFEARVHDGRLDGAAWGEAIDRARHAPAIEPKGATYTALKVAQEDDGRWLAQCVVDV